MNLIMVYGMVINLHMLAALVPDGKDCNIWFSSGGDFGHQTLYGHTCKEVFNEIKKDK